MENRKHKPGDKVKVRAELVNGRFYEMEHSDDAFTGIKPEMKRFESSFVTIADNGNSDFYEILEDGGKHVWTDQMFEFGGASDESL